MPIHLHLAKALGAFFSFVLILSSALAWAAGPTFPDDNELIEMQTGIVLVDGKPVRMEILHKRFSVEFVKVDALGIINYNRNPIYYDHSFDTVLEKPKHLYQIDKVLLLYNQVFLLVSDSSVPQDPKPEQKLLQVHLKHAGGLAPSAEKDVWMSLGAVAAGGYDSLAGYAGHALTPGADLGVAQIAFAAGVTSVGLFSTLAVQKLYEIYRVQNEFVELHQVKPMSGSENGIQITEITGEDGKTQDVMLHFSGGRQKSLAQIAYKSMCEMALISAPEEAKP